ncbi:MAG: integrase core domain-containing protein [Acidimicrobiales bacterium]
MGDPRTARVGPLPSSLGAQLGEFLRAQAKGMMACDFFSVGTVLLRHLYVLVLIDLGTRLLRVAGITADPVAGWATQQARDLSIELSERTTPVKSLIRDRDGKFPRSFDELFCADGARTVKSPVRAPRADATCERVIGTPRRECFDRTMILGRRHLEAVLAEYVRHYNDHRPHRSLAQHCPRLSDETPMALADIDPTRLRRADRLGGLTHEYRMVA